MKFIDPAVIVVIGAALAGFAAFLGGIGAFLSSRQQAQKSEEISALNKEIAAAQIELRKKSDEIAELNRTMVATVTGGDSYCYLALSNPGSNSALVVIVHQGNYPLYDVSIRMVDLDKFDRIKKEQPQPTLESWKLSETTLPVLNLSPGQASMMGTIPLPNPESIRYNIFISARNGMFTELLRLRKVNGVWKSAMKVEKKNYSEKTPNAPPTLLKEQVDPDFPKDKNGQIQWE